MPTAAATPATSLSRLLEVRYYKCNESGYIASACPKLRASAIYDLGEGELAEVEDGDIEQEDQGNENA
jgi:hypothetical protein